MAVTPHLRVLHVIDSLRAGGAERALVELCLALRKRGHTCAVASIQPVLQVADELTRHGVEVFCLDVEDPRALAHSAIRLRRVVRRVEPDVVHAHLFFAELATASLPQHLGAVRLVTFHNLGYDAYPVDSLWRRLRQQLEKAAVSRFDSHLAGATAIAEHYSRHLGVASIVAVPYACALVDIPAISPRSRAQDLSRLGLDPELPLVTLPASFLPEKGHRFLVEALATLRDHGQIIQAAFTSTGALRDDVQAQVRAVGLEGQVHFLGLLPTKHDVIRLMMMSDLVVLPSTNDGYPISAIEAMSSGVPVIASSVGGLAELIDDGVTGRLVRPADADALAAAIAELLRDEPHRRRMASAGSRKVTDLHDPARVAARHEQLYWQTIEQRRNREGASSNGSDARRGLAPGQARVS